MDMPARDARRNMIAFALAAAAAIGFSACSKGGPAQGVPENEAARIRFDGGKLGVQYDGRTVFSAEIAAGEAGYDAKVNVVRSGGAVTQTVLLAPRGKGGRVRLAGTVLGGPESFPCEADRRDRGPAVVRHVSGTSRSRLNRAVYDRGRDWVLSVDAGPRAVVSPLAEGGESREFGLEAEGAEIVLRFRPRYYQKHRGLAFFEPWAYRVWTGPVAGWISWFAFYVPAGHKAPEAGSGPHLTTVQE